MSTEIVAYEDKVGALSVVDVRAQVNLIQHVMREVMKKDEHYGVIPGTGTKPTLLKAGAEKLCLTFRLDPQYEVEQKQEGAHLTVMSKCTLYHIPSGQRYGSGMGSCSTKESKYAYRKSSRKCPDCSKETIIKGKAEYGGGWVCFKKKGGCGAKFDDGDQAIEGQSEGRVANEDIADQYNTVLKMANKRSLVAAVLNATAASDIFTQDIEDMPQFAAKVVTEDEDITQQIPGVGRDVVPPQAQTSLSHAAPAGVVVSVDQVTMLRDLFKECDKDAEASFLKIAKIGKLEELKAEDFDEAVGWIQRRRERNKRAS